MHGRRMRRHCQPCEKLACYMVTYTQINRPSRTIDSSFCPSTPQIHLKQRCSSSPSTSMCTIRPDLSVFARNPSLPYSRPVKITTCTISTIHTCTESSLIACPFGTAPPAKCSAGVSTSAVEHIRDQIYASLTMLQPTCNR